mgnify:CR=1 FL=1
MKTFILLLMSMFLFDMTDAFTDALVRLCGLESREALTEDFVEDYSCLARHPLDINSSSEEQLRNTGFFTSFQIASIEDYIKRNGPILSYVELAGITGIGKQMADDLSFFFMCGSSGNSMIGPESKKRLHIEGSMRNTIKADMKVSSKAKYEATYGRQLSAGLSMMDEAVKGYMNYTGIKWPIKIVMGSLNVRYGQGLLLWSGLSIGGVSQLSGFSRNPTGVNVSLASSSVEGVAVNWTIGRSCVDACALYGGGIAVHYGYRTHKGTYAMTAMYEKGNRGYSFDYKVSTWKITSFGELALYKGAQSMGTAFLGGAFYNVAYRRRVGVLLRYYSDNFAPRYCGSIHSGTTAAGEKGVGAAVEYEKVSLVADYSSKYGIASFKSIGKWLWNKSLGEWKLDGELRHTMKYKAKTSYYSNELRVCVNSTKGPLQLCSRLQLLKGRDFSALGYVEGALIYEKSRISARALYFDARTWEDRLYAYSRDVPGCFSVPVYYGKGIEWSFYARYGNMALRLSYTSYQADKANKWEVKGYVAF